MTETPIAELKACPFCGASAFTNEYRCRPFPDVSSAAEWRWEVVCRGDDEHHGQNHATEAAAITAWNTRAQSEVERELLRALRRLYRGYVHTLEIGRDRIISLGGTCDPIDVMEEGDPCLIAARAAIARATGATP